MNNGQPCIASCNVWRVTSHTRDERREKLPCTTVWGIAKGSLACNAFARRGGGGGGVAGIRVSRFLFFCYFYHEHVSPFSECFLRTHSPFPLYFKNTFFPFVNVLGTFLPFLNKFITFLLFLDVVKNTFLPFLCYFVSVKSCISFPNMLI